MIYEYGKVIFTGQTLEVYRFENAPKVATGPRKRRSQADNGGPRTPTRRSYGNVKRLKRNFVRLVQSNLSAKGAPAFLTLTCATNATLDTALQFLENSTAISKKNLEILYRISQYQSSRSVDRLISTSSFGD